MEETRPSPTYAELEASRYRRLKRRVTAVIWILVALCLWRAITFTVTHHCVRWEGSTCAWYQRDDGGPWTDGDTTAKSHWGWFYSILKDPTPDDPGDRER